MAWGNAMIQVHKSDILYARLRECWVRKDNLRISCDFECGFKDAPVWHAAVLESIEVYEPHRRQGHCKRFIEDLCKLDFDLVIVEGVQNEQLARALQRWVWEFDSGVMDFYRYIAH